MKKIKNKRLLLPLVFSACLLAVVLYAGPRQAAAPSGSSETKDSKNSAVDPASRFNKDRYPTDEAASLWAVVNKGRVLPSGYAPSNLVVPAMPLRLSASSPEMHVRAEAAAGLESMVSEAKKDNISLMLASGYRSYTEQQAVYQNYVSAQGAAAADRFSARPGHSEHQTGLAADLEPTSRQCEVEQCFENTGEGRWLAANAYRSGFIIRYGKDSESLTGYEYEPWHIRYVGPKLAGQLQAEPQTLEQFFGLQVYTTYPSQPLILKDK